MKFDLKQQTTARVSFLQLFRLAFVLFSLYLLRDAFYRWDGFKFYAPFTEYIPAVALVSVLWTITACLTTIIVWILFRSFESLSDRIALGIRTEHILLFGTVSILFGQVVWKIKRLIWADVQTSEQLKIIVLICVILVSTYMAWIFRNKAKHYFDIVQEHISPLVWLFGVFVMISVPLVSFHAWVKGAERPIPGKFPQSTALKSDKKSPNILLITFDTLTARDMSLYGYQRETTPFISKWAKNAAVFTTAEAANNHTSPTTASLMTGKRVWTHQLFQQGGSPVRGDTENLPRVLKENGYFNVALIVNPWASSKKLRILNSLDISPLSIELSLANGLITFDGYQPGLIDALLFKLFGDKILIHDWIFDTKFLGRLQTILSPRHKLMNPEYTKTAVPPKVAFNRFLEIYDNLPEPFFAWIHVYPPHTHYLPPEPYRGMFGPYLPPERYTELESDNSNAESLQNMHDLRILYDEFIRYCDKQFEDFILQLEKKNKNKDSIIILSADHGESFQHNYYGHRGPYLYEQLTHIPLVIKQPDQSDGQIIQSVVEQTDIPATILEFAHIPVPMWMEGRSLAPLLRGEELPSRPVFSMYFELNPSRGHQITQGLVAVWEGDYKLTHYLEDGRSLLFNLKEDPEELVNVIDSNSEIGGRLLDLIKTNLKKANERIMSDNLQE